MSSRFRGRQFCGQPFCGSIWWPHWDARFSSFLARSVPVWQLDGLSRSKDLVFLLAATNLPWELDSAMLRRLEKRVRPRTCTHLSTHFTPCSVPLKLPRVQTGPNAQALWSECRTTHAHRHHTPHRSPSSPVLSFIISTLPHATPHSPMLPHFPPCHPTLPHHQPVSPILPHELPGVQPSLQRTPSVARLGTKGPAWSQFC